MSQQNNLIQMYKEMSPEKLQIEIDAMFEIIYAILESQECDSIETYPTPDVRLKFSCEVIQDANERYLC